MMCLGGENPKGAIVSGYGLTAIPDSTLPPVCYASKEGAVGDGRNFGFVSGQLGNFMEAAALERAYGIGGGSKPRRGNPRDGFGMK